MEVAVSVIRIEVDDEALAEVIRLTGSGTAQEAVGLALQEYVARHQRVTDHENAVRRARGWDYDGWRRQRQAEQGGEPPG
jgi:Arc/MetJ family transcription regulator